ncbi:hypothetical protein RRG08_064798 [Elysia crispata]|uniref:Glycosyltransferase family 92 protein n=1 Tax=Elysia crispata TaxID=231223 RepID=A0AAE1ASU6_9GAST|nr:hypothetical protein RRG08_064798 [Elysia crispata]
MLLCFQNYRQSGLVRWHIPKLPPNFYQESPAFLQVRNSDTYLYSALTNMAPQGAPDSVALTKDPNRAVSSIVPTERKVRVSLSYGYIVQELDQDLEVIITGLDRSRSWASSFVCCVKTEEEDRRTEGDARPSFTTTARTYFEYVKPFSWERWIKEYWLAYSPSVYVATQYSCRIPRKHLSPSNMPMFATLAPMPSLFAKTLSPLLLLSWLDLFWGYESYCPREGTEYLPVEYPDKVPDGLGLCSKVNHNSPNPEVILEWLELQRHLGVDRVVVYDMGNNSPQLNRLFLHYEVRSKSDYKGNPA